MANKSHNDDIKLSKGNSRQRKHPEFKPGNTPSYLLDGELLNGNVNWLMTLGEILSTGEATLSAIAKEIGVPTESVSLLLDNDASSLTFNAGAKLLTIHERMVIKQRMLEAA